MWKKIKWALALAAVPALMGYLGCGVEDPQPPTLAGPSELAVSLKMQAVPDQLTADGWSSSVIEATWRDENGERVGGKSSGLTSRPRRPARFWISVTWRPSMLKDRRTEEMRQGLCRP